MILLTYSTVNCFQTGTQRSTKAEHSSNRCPLSLRVRACVCVCVLALFFSFFLSVWRLFMAPKHLVWSKRRQQSLTSDCGLAAWISAAALSLPSSLIYSLPPSLLFSPSLLILPSNSMSMVLVFCYCCCCCSTDLLMNTDLNTPCSSFCFFALISKYFKNAVPPRAGPL